MSQYLLAACLALLLGMAAPHASSQGTGAPAKKPPLSQKQLAEKKKAIQDRAATCATRARQSQLKQGSKEFVSFMTGCLNPQSEPAAGANPTHMGFKP